MSQTDFGIIGRRGVNFSDPLFIYIDFGERNHPDNNELVRDIIEEIDIEHFSNDTKSTIRKCLPFLTFKQTELLFRKLRDNFDIFSIKGIALATQLDSYNTLTGKANIDQTPRIVPFEITKSYKNIVIPLIEEAHRDPRFKNNSYEKLSIYFNNPQKGLIPNYGVSLGLSRTEFPLYPTPGSIKGELKREMTSSSSRYARVNKGGGEKRVMPEDYYSSEPKPDKLSRSLSVVAVVLSTLGLVVALRAHSNLSFTQQSLNQVAVVSTNTEKIQDKEHELDTYARYFLSAYYSGDKNDVAPFLANNNAKYTIPQAQTVMTMLFQDIAYNAKENIYTLAYVISMKDADNSVTQSRIEFNVVADKEKTSGWSVSSEPTSTPFEPDRSEEERKEQRGETTSIKSPDAKEE